MPAQLTLLSCPGCHLCEQLLAQLQPLAQTLGFEIEIRDVDEDEQTLARWGREIPVLLNARGEELCRHTLDVVAIHAWARTLASGGER